MVEIKDFMGLEKKNIKDSEKYKGPCVECPVCHGYGGWIIQRDAYGRGRHFQASCSQCVGWGYVRAGSKDATCIHEYKELSAKAAEILGRHHFGNCYHIEQCKLCGQVNEYDSSD